MVVSRMAYLKLWQSQNDADEAAPSLVERLTKREMDILRLIADGLSNKEIALRLNITEGTTKIHIVNIYGKLQVNRRVKRSPKQGCSGFWTNFTAAGDCKEKRIAVAGMEKVFYPQAILPE